MNKNTSKHRLAWSLVLIFLPVILLGLRLSYLYYDDYCDKVYAEKQYNIACSMIKVDNNIKNIKKSLEKTGFGVSEPKQHYGKWYLKCSWDSRRNRINFVQTLYEICEIPCFHYPVCVIIYFDKESGKVIEFSPYL